MAIPADLLKSIPYFAGLDGPALDAIKQTVFEKRVDRGEIVALEGEPAEALFFVANGAVKVFKTSPEGKEQILTIVRPGESFNDVPIFDDGPNPASAQAMVDGLVYGIASDNIGDIMRDHPRFADNIIKVLAQRVRQLVDLVEDLSFRHVLSRVAKILLEYGIETAEPRPRLTQQEIAAMAGTAREVVGRSLKSLEESSVIRVEHHRVVISDKDALRQLAAEVE